MPELPEVETVRRVIEPQIVGRRIEHVRIYNEQVIAHPGCEAFVRALTNECFSGLDRRGKYLRFSMKSGVSLILHLRMTGQLLVTPRDEPMEKHTHLTMALSSGSELRYTDVRRFGRLWLFAPQEKDDLTGITLLGLEPDDPLLTAPWLTQRLAQSKKPVKSMLLDQSLIAGIGNIYSDEILFAAGINPMKKCSDLTNDEVQRLARAIPETMAYFTKANAISPEDTLAGKGKEYRNTPFLRVYGHAGESCPVCGATLQKVTLAGRSCVFCPRCQQ